MSQPQGQEVYTRWYQNQEMMYSIFCGGIVFSLLFWPLLNSLCCLALFGYWLFFSRKLFPFSGMRSFLVVLFSLLYILVIVGVFYSSNMKEAVFKLQQKSPLLLLPIVLGCTPALTSLVRKRSLTILCWSTCAGLLICLIHGVVVLIRTGSTVALHGYPMVILKDMHPVVLGLCSLLSLAFIFETWYQSRQERKFKLSWIDFLLVPVFIVFLFLVGNRSNLICLAFLIVFYCFRLITTLKTRLIILSAFAFVLVLSVLFNPSLRSQWKDLTDFSAKNNIDLNKSQDPNYNWGGKTIRLTIWICSMDIINETWATGVGTGDVYDALARAYERRNFNAAYGHREYNAHNQFLQETIAYGIAGFLIFVSAIVVPLFYFARKKTNTVYVLFLLLFAFVCLTEGLLELNKGIVWYAFFNALLAFSWFNKPKKASETKVHDNLPA